MLPSQRLYSIILLYVTPLLACLFIAVALIKPLIARRPKPTPAIILTSGTEPLLFALIHKICDSVGAPRPARVQIDCQVNASASLVSGVRGFFGNELTLTLGMPLVAGMAARELAGVLAPEFGHFAQAAGMRASVIIFRINHWFYRTVELRDSWDEALEKLVTKSDGWIGLALVLAKFAATLARRVLAGLRWAGEVVSRALLRQMEFDADRYEAVIAGSRQFRRTARQLRLLGHAFSDVHHDLRESWENRKLVDNLPELIHQRAKDLEPTMARQIDQEIAETQTHAYDTHPADSARIANAERLNAPGVFKVETPARQLFKNYAALAKRSTLHYYQTSLGLSVKENQLISFVELEQTVSVSRQSQAALNSYFLGFADRYHFLKPLSLAPPPDGHERLHALTCELRERKTDIERLVGLIAKVRKQAVEAFGEKEVAAFTANNGARAHYEKTHAQWQGLMQERDAIETLFCERLNRGLAMALAHPESGAHANDETEAVVRAQQILGRLAPTHETVALLAEGCYRLSQLANDNNAPAREAQRRALEKLKAETGTIEAALKQTKYPFTRAGGATDLFAHLSEELPKAQDALDYLNYVYRLLEAMADFNVKVLGRLAMLAEHAESQLEEKTGTGTAVPVVP
jgi:Zn-dependent protease with chaperone function